MTEKKLHGTRVALVIAPDQFRDEELFTPMEKLQADGASTTIASKRLGTASGMLGKTAETEVLIKDLKPAELDAIIVVGGMGSPEHLWDDSELHGLLKELHQQDKIVAAICLSGAVLARAGLLEGKRATVWEMKESLQALEQGKAHYVKEPVVQDGKIITANGPEAAGDFADLIIAALTRVKV